MSDLLLRLPDLLPVAPQNTPCSFHHVTVQEHISLLPCYVGQLSKGIIEHLNKKVLRYSDDYGGVVLSYSRPMVLQQCGRILDEQPHIHLEVKYEAYIFKPAIGDVMCGTVNKIGDGHIGCLVHNCFNASVISKRTDKHRRTLNGWFDTEQFDVGSEIWFRVCGLENVSGILVVQGEYYEEIDTFTEASIDGDIPPSSSRQTADIDSSVSYHGHKKKRKKKRIDSETEASHRHGNVDDGTLLSKEERKQKKRKRKTKDRDVEDEVTDKVGGAKKIKRHKQTADISKKHED